jgi:hypothetical protein
MRHKANRRNTARCRPHRRHRVYRLAENFARRLDLLISAFFAIGSPYAAPAATAGSPRKGNPSARRRARPSSSVSAVVTIVMSMPRTASI